MRTTIASDVAREYCRQFPHASTHQLSRMLAKQEPRLFTDATKARDVVRWVRGQRRNKRGAAVKQAVPKLELPKAEPSQFRVVPLVTGLRYLVLSDVHLPYHDAGALLAACEYGEAAKCNAILLLGDILDCYSLSHYERDPRARSFASELESMGQLIDYLNHAFTPRAFYWKLGNHEHRYHRYMMQHAPELVGVPQFGWSSFLDLERRKVTLVDENHVLRCGHLTLLHGHEWGGGLSSPVNPARGAFLRATSCTLSGHLHRTSQHNEQPLSGGLIGNWSLGCLCDLHPRYATLNKWNHGFAILDTSKSWTVRNLRIVDGEVME